MTGRTRHPWTAAAVLLVLAGVALDLDGLELAATCAALIAATTEALAWLCAPLHRHDRDEVTR